MNFHADKKRLPSPVLEVGDKVILDGKFIKTSQLSDSIDHRNLGLFTILRIVNDHSYMLDLLLSMKVFPIFHPLLLHLHETQLLEDQIQEPLGPVNVDKTDTNLQEY